MTARPVAPAGYQLECPDPALAAALGQWLDESGLQWPGPLRIVARLVPALATSEDAREILHESDVDIQSGPPDGTVRIHWADGPAAAVVHQEHAEVVLQFTPEALTRFEVAERGFLLVVLLFVLRRLGWYHVHGAALTDPTGRGWMLVGNSRTGKSTTTALLAASGWAVSTDDIAFLERDGSRVAVRGFRSPIALREDGRALLAAQGHLPSEGTVMGRRRKTGFTPEALGGRWIARVVPEVLLFPTIGASTTIEPMRPGEVLSALVVWSRWVLYEALHSQQHLDLLGLLAAQSRSFRATIGPDLVRHPALLQELVP